MKLIELNSHLENVELDADILVGIRVPHLGILLAVRHQGKHNILQHKTRVTYFTVWPMFVVQKTVDQTHRNA